MHISHELFLPENENLKTNRQKISAVKNRLDGCKTIRQ